jgi:hypothetical protein
MSKRVKVDLIPAFGIAFAYEDRTIILLIACFGIEIRLNHKKKR